jgi:hypothetical protein
MVDADRLARRLLALNEALAHLERERPGLGVAELGVVGRGRRSSRCALWIRSLVRRRPVSLRTRRRIMPPRYGDQESEPASRATS